MRSAPHLRTHSSERSDNCNLKMPIPAQWLKEKIMDPRLRENDKSGMTVQKKTLD